MHKGSPIIPILRGINPIPRIDIHFLTVILSFHLRLGLPEGLFPVDLPVNSSKVPLPSSILSAWTLFQMKRAETYFKRGIARNWTRDLMVLSKTIWKFGRWSFYNNYLTSRIMDQVAQCRIYKGSPIIPILSRINPIPRMIHISLRSILTLSSHQRLGIPKGLFPVGLPVKILNAHDLTISIFQT